MIVDTSELARSCSCLKEHKIDVKEIIIESGATEKLEIMMNEGLLKEYFHPVIICDTNTYEATIDIMERFYDRCSVIRLEPEGLHADNHKVEIVSENLEETADLLLAVGAGTIHDITRYIAHVRHIPFVSVPTAASVDGFVSTVAAMTWNGMKKTIPAVAPICVIADTDIFANAPAYLNASGVSDLLGKYICLADWKIAHLLTGEYICERVYQMEQDAINEVERCLRGIPEGDHKACESLMYALLVSGLAMQMIGNSRPASCAEHHISHLWEMEVVNEHVAALHGEKVGVGTLLCINEYKRIAQSIREGRCKVQPYTGLETKLLQETFGQKGLYDAVVSENTPDPMQEVEAKKLQRLLFDIADIIEEIPQEHEMKKLLAKAGAVNSLAELHLSEEIIPLTLQLSPYVRNRLSFMRISKMLETV
ncbi:MAG: sn-glycerol-1-phosphate dehydrogenase [Lachnospiraceae bacterium]